MISSRVGCVWKGCERKGSMLARTMSNSSFGTTSLRQSHSSSVHGETKSTFSAAVTKRRAARSGLEAVMDSSGYGSSRSTCRRALLGEGLRLRLLPLFLAHHLLHVEVDECAFFVADDYV